MARIESIEHLRRLIPDAAPLVSAKIREHLDDQAADYVARSPFLVMATSSDQGIELSPKGGAPGFVAIENPRSLLIPERKGNGLAFGLRNILADNRVGVAFFLPATWEMLRIVGRAELHDDAALCERLSDGQSPALLAIRLHVERAYFQCARSLRRAKFWDPASWREPQRISFGRIIAEALGRQDLEHRVEEAVERSKSDL